MDAIDGVTDPGHLGGAGRNPVLDEAALDGIRALDPGGSRGVLPRLIRLYQKDAPRLLSSLEEHASKADPEALWRAAHTLKTSSANLGAARLAALCRELEALGRGGSTEGAVELAAAAAAALEEASRALLALLPEHGRETD